MSADEPYGLRITANVKKAVSKGGPIPVDVAHAAYKLMTTELCHDPYRCGWTLLGWFQEREVMSCKRENFRLIYKVDEDKRLVIVLGIQAR